MKNSCWSVLLLLILSGSTFASEKMICKVVTNWNDGFGNYHYREVCDFSNGDRTVTDCTAYGCDVERTTAAERKNENTMSEAAAHALKGVLKHLSAHVVREQGTAVITTKKLRNGFARFADNA